jgi:hypothetical protein
MKKIISLLIVMLCLVGCVAIHDFGTTRNAVMSDIGRPSQSFSKYDILLDCYKKTWPTRLYLYRDESLVAWATGRHEFRELFVRYVNFDTVGTIISRRIQCGFTKLEVILSWGFPKYVNRYCAGREEQWVYRGKTGPIYLYFENGLVYDWQDSITY